jgi:hypothetical protein
MDCGVNHCCSILLSSFYLASELKTDRETDRDTETGVYLCLLLQGWYIVTYGLGIYILNLLIAFLSPKIDPALAELDSNGELCIQTSNPTFKHYRRL